MRRIVYLLCVFELFSLAVIGQDIPGDFRLAADSTRWNAYRLARDHAFWMEELMPTKYSQAIIKGNIVNGKLMDARDATNIKRVQASSEGITELSGFKLFGSFSYTKVLEDSTRMTQQSRDNPTAPYAFGSVKYNHYERSVYDLKANAYKNLTGKNLPLAIGFDYKIGKHFSNNDPRADIATFQMDINATLGYKLLDDKLKIGAGYRGGYGKEEIAIGFKKDAYYQSTRYPDYNNRLFIGYEYDFWHNNNRSYQTDFRRSGFGLYAEYQQGHHRALGHFEYTHEKQDYAWYGSSIDPYELSYYGVDYNDLGLLYMYRQDSSTNLSVNYNMKMLYGKDFVLFKYLGNITINEIINHELTVRRSRSNLHKTNNMSVGVRYNSDSKKNGLYGNVLAYDHLVGNLTWGQQFCLKAPGRSLGYDLSLMYRYVLDQTFVMPGSSENVFEQYVIYHDYIYNASDIMGIGGQLQYSFLTGKTVHVGLKLGANYQFSVKEGQLPGGGISRTVLSTPGKERFNLNAALQLFF
ncbi:hypothetical protein COR50_19305 [Chitinophaga caeni]|uniref:DUF6850 domain-containing protein n=1 Tax=Chitinophaga caeni TaxID=2029983 RepID=A0A291QYX8_9BACT|nr:DUF6850 family outer membrane beta-barrel protein [Chitinophaga caeni]ATL49148.1 hypothetical protein COR50_19305 [Chitinophaga caeni]